MTLSRFRFRVRTLLIATTVVACAVVVLRWFEEPTVSLSQMRQLQPGMTATQIEAILGYPHYINDLDHWIYRRSMKRGYFVVSFTRSGHYHGYAESVRIP